MTTTYSGLERFQRPKLKLLDRAFRPAEFHGDFLNGLLFDESFDEHGPLIFRKSVHELKQCGATLDIAPTRLIEILGQAGIDCLLRLAPPIDNGIRSNAKEPHRKRYSSPFEARKIRQGVMEHFGGNILSLVPVLNAANDERVNPLKVRFIEFGEAAGILLCGLNIEFHYDDIAGLQR